MSDEPILLPDDPEYHLKYDTNNMTREEHFRLRVAPVKVPVTPNFNIERMFTQLHTEYAPLDDEGADAYDARLESYLIERLQEYPEDQVAALMHKWTFWARDNQLPPVGTWTYWLLLAGRGFGKTRTGAEWVNRQVELGLSKRIALVAPTAADVRKVMVEGESGILAKAPPWNRPHFEPSKLQLTWPNGAIAQMFSAEEPERLRGPQCDTFWADELCAWKKMQETWDMLMFGFRLGRNPQGCITTTPKPVPLLKKLVEDQKTGTTEVVKGSTYDNRGNLAKPFFDKVVKDYEGTRLGRQELEADILEDMPGALWDRAGLDRCRIPCNIPPLTRIIGKVNEYDQMHMSDANGDIVLADEWEALASRAAEILAAVPEDLTRITINVDPNASNNEGSDEIGITATGLGLSGQGYLLADLSMRGSPNEWGSTCVLAHDLFKADKIIGEANQGGNMVEHTIMSSAKFLKLQGLRKSDFVGVTLVHATRGKVTRAEPVSALYEQKRVSHVGTHRTLEDQMCLFTSDFDRKAMGYSPDRVDSLVWGFTHLFLEDNDTGLLQFYQEEHMKQKKEADERDDPALFVKMKAPSGVNQAYGQSGAMYSVDAASGCISVPREEVRGFRAGGFVEV